MMYTELPEWFSPGKKIALLTRHGGIPTIRVRTVERETKTQVVLDSGDRYTKPTPDHPWSTFRMWDENHRDHQWPISLAPIGSARLSSGWHKIYPADAPEVSQVRHEALAAQARQKFVGEARAMRWDSTVEDIAALVKYGQKALFYARVAESDNHEGRNEKGQSA